jgi:hypothetical protein
MDIEIFCDESRQDYFAHALGAKPGRYMAIGGLWIESQSRALVKEQIRSLRRRYAVGGEFKWSRVSPSRLDFYLEMVDLFFTSGMRFRSIVIETHRLDAPRFHDGDDELMFYKFYYQLLHHWIDPSNAYRIFVDMKTNRVGHRLTHLRDVLRNANTVRSILDVQALPSHEVDLLQLDDLLLGATSFRLNGSSESAAKVAVASRIEHHLGHTIGPTTKGEEKFNVFRWLPGGG